MAVTEAKVKPRLKTRYDEEISPALRSRFGYDNPMQVPRVDKVTLNMGVGEAKQDSKMLDAAVEQLGTIAGQKPNVRRARKSIANFKLRDGMPVGVSVTLRGARMYEFLDRLMSIAIPRIRDFRGLNPRSFDGRGNWTVGIREQIIFPEIDYDSIDQVRGMDITITTSAPTDEEAFALLEAMGMPFQEAGRPGQEETADAAEEERHAEEARLKAEAEQAALEQLKEENPEAYAKPESPEEGEEGETSEAHEPRRPTRWPRLHSACASSARPSSRPAGTTAAASAAARVPTCASSACAGSACATTPTRATSPA